MNRRPLLLALAAPVAGCKLIDQRTFDASAGTAPPRAVAPPAPPAPPARRAGPQPLVLIPLDPAVEYDAPLHDAIVTAVSRGRRDFDVRTAVPATGTPEAQAAATQSAAPAAARVARIVAAAGGRTVLSAEADPALTGPVVLVFVR